MINWLKGKKAYLIMIATIAYAVAVEGVQNGNWGVAMNMILAALGLGSLRAGVSKK